MKLSDFSKIVDGKLINLKEDVDIKGLSIDSRKIKSGELFFALKGLNSDGHKFVVDALKKGAAGAVIEKKVEGENLIFVKSVSSALLDFSKWKLSEVSIPKICITGSSGKTSTKELISSVLSKKFKVFKTSGNYNNLIGVPLSLWNLKGSNEVGVFELGMSFHGEIFKMAEIIEPDYGVITNIGSVHMMNFLSRKELTSAKFELVENLKKGGVFFYNGDDKLLDEFAKKFCVKKMSVGFNPRNDFVMENLTLSLSGMEFNLKIGEDVFKIKSKLLSKSFAYNISFSFLIGREFGVDEKDILESIAQFKPFLHRCEVLKLKNGAILIDDSYNSNPEALRGLLDTVFQISEGREILLVIGEMKELGVLSEESHRDTGIYLKNRDFKKAFLIGGDSRYLFDEIGEEKGKFFENYEESFDEIIREIDKNTLIVVKGSRGVMLDRVVDKILEVYGE